MTIERIVAQVPVIEAHRDLSGAPLHAPAPIVELILTTGYVRGGWGAWSTKEQNDFLDLLRRCLSHFYGPGVPRRPPHPPRAKWTPEQRAAQRERALKQWTPEARAAAAERTRKQRQAILPAPAAPKEPSE